MVKKAASQEKEKTVFLLYVPGGSMLGLIPSKVLERLEKITETPAAHLFQAMSGVSTGSIIAAGLNVPDPDDPKKPKISASELVDLFCEFGPQYFPDIPKRGSKMLTANISNFIKGNIDPLELDRIHVQRLDRLCTKLEKLPATVRKDRVEMLRELSTTRWLTEEKREEAIALNGTLSKISADEACEICNEIEAIIKQRTVVGKLSSVFRRSVIGGLDCVENLWARDYFFDLNEPITNYKNQFGDTTISGGLRSIYISSYDMIGKKIKTFSCRKDDLFNPNTDGPSTLRNNDDHALWDAVMASTANPFAWPAHITEDGTACEDKASVHSPLPAFLDLYANLPENTNLKLVILGTGETVMPDEDRDMVVKKRAKLGVVGTVMQGKEIPELERYAMSMAREAIENLMGPGYVEENIIEITPNLYFENPKQEDKTPDGNSLNSSEENLEKIIGAANDLLKDRDRDIKDLAYMLVENLKVLGQIEEDKYNRVMHKLSRTPYFEKEEDKINEKLPKIFHRATLRKNIVSNAAAMIKNLWNKKSSGEDSPDDKNGPDTPKPPQP
jgi:hypothetical protein